MTQNKKLIISIEEFLVEYASKKFTEDEIMVWGMNNLPSFGKDSFCFFKRTLKMFYHSIGSSNFVITYEKVNDMWKKNPNFLKEFNAKRDVK